MQLFSSLLVFNWSIVSKTQSALFRRHNVHQPLPVNCHIQKYLNLNSQDISLVVGPSGHKLSLEAMEYLMTVITKDNF